MRTASLVISLVLFNIVSSNSANAGFCLEDSHALRFDIIDHFVGSQADRNAEGQRLLEVESTKENVPPALTPAATICQVAAWYQDLGSLDIEPTALLLPIDFLQRMAPERTANSLSSQLQKTFNATERQLGELSLEPMPFVMEEFGVRMLLFVLIASVWVYGRHYARRNTKSTIQGILKEIAAEMTSFEHEQATVDQALRDLLDFYSGITAHCEYQTVDGVRRKTLFAHELIRRISTILPRHPMKPSLSLLTYQHFADLLLKLRESRRQAPPVIRGLSCPF